MEDIMKLVNSLEDSGLLIKHVSRTRYKKNEAKEQKKWFLGMLLGNLGACLLGNLLTAKGATATSQGRGSIRAGENILISPHPLTNFEIQKFYQNEPKFNVIYSRSNLPKKRVGHV